MTLNKKTLVKLLSLIGAGVLLHGSAAATTVAQDVKYGYAHGYLELPSRCPSARCLSRQRWHWPALA
jgi:hypothetical protein